MDPARRGQGIAKALFLKTIERAEALQGLAVLQLSVEEQNTAAHELYLSCGFVEYGCEPKASLVNDHFVNDRLMWKAIA